MVWPWKKRQVLLPKECTVQIFFEDFPQHLTAWIARQEAIVGCVAWVTRPDVVEALSQKQHSSIVMRHQQMQDMGKSSALCLFKPAMREALSVQDLTAPPGFEARYWLYPKSPPIMGQRKRGQFTPVSLLHHKFLVGGRVEGNPGQIVGKEVWCGSWNFTYGSEKNRDTAWVIADAAISQKFVREWWQLLTQSIPFSQSYVVRRFARTGGNDTCEVPPPLL